MSSAHLSSAQFKDVPFVERDPNDEGYNFSVASVAHGEGLRPRGGYDGAMVHLDQPRTEYYYPRISPGYQENWDTRTESHRYGPEDVHDGIGRVRGRQQTLFGYHHVRPTVDFMLANRGYQHYAASLLGVAALESRARYGEDPVASSDLSPHSSRLVGRLARAGAVQYPGPDEEHRNTLDFPDHPAAYLWGSKYEEIQPSRMAAGRRAVVEAIRGSAPGRKAAASRKATPKKPQGAPKGQQPLF